jgi:hypothetical protein
MTWQLRRTTTDAIVVKERELADWFRPRLKWLQWWKDSPTPKSLQARKFSRLSRSRKFVAAQAGMQLRRKLEFPTATGMQLPRSQWRTGSWHDDITDRVFAIGKLYVFGTDAES